MSIKDRINKIKLHNLSIDKQNKIMNKAPDELVPIELNQLKIGNIEKYYNPKSGNLICKIDVN